MPRNLIYQYYLPYTGPDENIKKQNANGLPDWAEIGLNSAKKYAEAIGVEHMFCNEVTINAPNQNLESGRVFLDPFFDDFDNVLVLDIDTLVNTKQNIFDLPFADVAMIQDGGPGAPAGFIRNITRQIEAYGGKKLPQSKTYPGEKRYLNGGVVMWSKEGRLKARKRFGGVEEMWRYRKALKMNEQPYLNLMLNLHDVEVTEWDNMWNKLNYKWKFGIPDGHINHFLARSKTMMKDFK